jgi:hypothetical protein
MYIQCTYGSVMMKFLTMYNLMCANKRKKKRLCTVYSPRNVLNTYSYLFSYFHERVFLKIEVRLPLNVKWNNSIEIILETFSYLWLLSLASIREALVGIGMDLKAGRVTQRQDWDGWVKLGYRVKVMSAVPGCQGLCQDATLTHCL